MLTLPMSTLVRYHRLPTERRHPRSRQLDTLSIAQLLRLMNREDARVVQAVARELPRIARAATLIARSLRGEHRLFLVGAGTSGRLGVLEASECPPTFQTNPSMIQAILAGGPRAVFRAQEGAEDDQRRARSIMQQHIRAGDVVIGITASGVTPFVTAALSSATRRGAATILLTCNPQARTRSTLRIAVPVGPEVLTGSTRLKAGTATKLVLNMLTVGAMVQLGKTHGNLMVDVRPTSKKLRARAIHIVQSLSACDAWTAARLLDAARGRAKVAVVMARGRLGRVAAQRRLDATDGLLRRALSLGRRGRTSAHR